MFAAGVVRDETNAVRFDVNKAPFAGTGDSLVCPPQKKKEPQPYTLHPTPYTLHPTPYTLHPTPGNLKLYTPHPKPQPQTYTNKTGDTP